MRALAALIVVVFHIQGELKHRGFADPFPDLTVGAWGVDLFFVVSGFIMVFASERLFGRPGARSSFLMKRVARIAPLYWAFSALFTAIAVSLGHLPGHPKASWPHILASFLFIPAARPEDGGIFPVYALGWTLNYEMFFYVCFAATIGFGRSRAVAGLSCGLVALVVVGSLFALPWPLSYWANSISLEFVFGMAIAWAYRRGHRVPARIGLVLSAAAVVAVPVYVPYIDSQSGWRGLAWGIPAAIVVAAALGIAVDPARRPVRWAVRLGDASFSLYLVHSTLFIAIFAVASRLIDPRVVPSLVYAGLLLGGSVVAALLLFRGFEAPVTRRLNRLIDARRALADATRMTPASEIEGAVGR